MTYTPEQELKLRSIPIMAEGLEKDDLVEWLQLLHQQNFALQDLTKTLLLGGIYDEFSNQNEMGRGFAPGQQWEWMG